MPSLFPQNVIAVVWDFDKTLIPGYMQQPIFDFYGVDAKTFWNEANGLKDYYRDQGISPIAPDTLYLTHMLTYVEEGIFHGLSNRGLREFGSQLEFCPGLPDFFPRLKRLVESNPAYVEHEITLEHYIVSTGLSEMIRGSDIAEHVESIWGCQFVERVARPGYLKTAKQESLDDAPVIRAVGYAIDNTAKTRAIFEINKGSNKFPDIDVNATIAESERRVPFENMIYIADGPSDVPVFSLVGRFGGMTYAVYDPHSRASFDQTHDLLEKRRVQGVAPFDYAPDSQADMWLTRAVTKIADRLVRERDGHRAERVGKPPRHIVETPSTGNPTPVPTYSFVPQRAVPQLVEDLLVKAGVTEAPVPLEPILRELKIELAARKGQREDAVIVPMTDPALGVPEAWQVTYNPDRPESRRRFTIAHEVGHAVLHGSPHGVASARGDGGNKTRERDADAFAAELLMPRKFMRSAVEEFGANAEALAVRFQVSAEAMSNRLSELGLPKGEVDDTNAPARTRRSSSSVRPRGPRDKGSAS
jgi:hypothetical protein